MNRIESARKEKGLSQKEVAITLKVSQPTVSNWEAGRKTPAGKNLRALSKLLDVSIDELIGDSSLPKATEAQPKEAPEGAKARVLAKVEALDDEETLEKISAMIDLMK